METFDVFVPREESVLRRTIDPGSAIVGTSAFEWLNPGSDEPADDGRLVIDYEGRRYNQANMVTFADKAVHAAGRHRERYPTVARLTVEAKDLIPVGTFYYDEQRVQVENAEHLNELRKWLFPDLPVQDGFDRLYAEFRGTSIRAR